MLKLTLQLFFLLIFILLDANANDMLNIRVSCAPIYSCSNIIARIAKEKIPTNQMDKIKTFMGLILENAQINYLSYQVLEDHGKHFLDIKLRWKRKISKIIFNIPGYDYVDSLRSLMDVKEWDYLDERSLIESIRKVEEYFSTIGYPNANLSYQLVEDHENYEIFIKGSIANKVIINRFEVLSPNANLRKRVELFFTKYQGKIYNKLLISVDLENLRDELQREGFLQIKVKELPPLKIKDNNEVIVVLEINLGERYQFFIRDNRFFDKLQFKQLLFERLKANEFVFSDEIVGHIIQEELSKRGYYQVTTKIKVEEATSKLGIKILNYYIDFQEGPRKMIENITFDGANEDFFPSLHNLYLTGKSSLVKNKIFDKTFLDQFPTLVERFYISSGFSFVTVQGPNVTRLSDDLFDVNYMIKEGQQISVNTFLIQGLNNVTLDLELLGVRNLPGQSYNPYALLDDLEKILSSLKEMGYLHAKYSSVDAKDILTFTREYKLVTIKVQVNTGNLFRLNAVEIFAPDNVEAIVLDREIDLRPGDIITPKKIEKVRESLRQLGLFSTVDVELRPLTTHNSEELVNLFIRVKEKKFGIVEFAPGYRTDLGFKVSSTVTYNNLLQRNIIAAFKLQANLRDSNDGLDPSRVSSNNRKLEGMIETSLVEPYLFNYPVVAELTVGNEAKRFYAFDANITRVTAGVSRNIWERVELGLTYKFEFINQVDATDLKDSGFIQIGSFTPSIGYDQRDSKQKTTKGFYLGLSYQLAKPEFGSRRDQDLTIDYSKIIASSKFYYPLHPIIVLALSLGVGLEMNHRQDIVWNTDRTAPLLTSDGRPRTLGNIPSIDVFRLDGPYNVRGYSDREINRLGSGKDINDEVIQDHAYFVNIKVEPRYFYSDNIVMGPFWDAGRLFTNGPFSKSLRSSFGITVKYMTPIGSLDFDYGIKLFPGKRPDGGSEQISRFHLSVGTF